MLNELPLDHRNIEEEALVEKWYLDRTGETRVAQVVDRAKLTKLIKARAEQGQKLMEPFRLWCVTYKGLSADNAHSKAATVFISIWETHNRPWEKLLREDISSFRKNDLRRGLKLFGEWLSTTAATEEDKDWGRRILSHTARLKASKGKQIKRLKKEDRKRQILEPLGHQEWLGIFKGIELWHKRRGAARPWARNFFRLKFKAGLAHTKTGLYYLRRHDVGEALYQYEHGTRSAVVKVWPSASRALLLPVRLVQKELQELYDYPAAWGILADIIAPFGEDESARVRSCRKAITTAWKDIVKHSDGLVELGPEWHRRAKIAAIREAWEKTHDKLLLQAMFGHSTDWINRFDFID